MTVIPHWLEKRAFLTPEQTALQFSDKSRKTFQELRDDSIEFARKLSFLGVKNGEHISLLANNSYEMVVAIHALSYLQAKVILLNTRLSPRELAFQFEDSESVHLIYQDGLVGKTIEILKANPINKHTFSQIKAAQTKKFPIPSEMSLDDIFTIIYTSGTTGFPKGVQLTIGNHFWSATSSALNLGLHSDDRWLATLPLFHVGGLSILIKSVIYGMPVHLHERFSIEAVHKEIMEEGITIVSVVSVMLEQLIERLGNNSYPNNLRCMLLGGGPASKPLLESCKKKQIPVFQSYGMTETSSQIVTLSAKDALVKLGSCGKALFPAQIKIVHNNKIAKPNEVGEILVKGPMVTSGYFNREAVNMELFEDHWLKTGDLGYIDEEGYLYMMDRRKDLIISGGENVYPAEIESVLKEMNEIVDAGVVGKSDSKWGQVPIAFIVIREGSILSKEDIIDHCLKRLAKYKVPKAYYFIDELPRNASKKLLRRTLVEWLNKGVVRYESETN